MYSPCPHGRCRRIGVPWGSRVVCGLYTMYRRACDLVAIRKRDVPLTTRKCGDWTHNKRRISTHQSVINVGDGRKVLGSRHPIKPVLRRPCDSRFRHHCSACGFGVAALAQQSASNVSASRTPLPSISGAYRRSTRSWVIKSDEFLRHVRSQGRMRWGFRLSG